MNRIHYNPLVGHIDLGSILIISSATLIPPYPHATSRTDQWYTKAGAQAKPTIKFHLFMRDLPNPIILHRAMQDDEWKMEVIEGGYLLHTFALVDGPWVSLETVFSDHLMGSLKCVADSQRVLDDLADAWAEYLGDTPSSEQSSEDTFEVEGRFPILRTTTDAVLLPEGKEASIYGWVEESPLPSGQILLCLPTPSSDRGTNARPLPSDPKSNDGVVIKFEGLDDSVLSSLRGKWLTTLVTKNGGQLIANVGLTRVGEDYQPL